MLRLDVAAGVKPNGKPPVRIFLGTEAGSIAPSGSSSGR